VTSLVVIVVGRDLARAYRAPREAPGSGIAPGATRFPAVPAHPGEHLDPLLAAALREVTRVLTGDARFQVTLERLLTRTRPPATLAAPSVTGLPGRG